MNEIRKGDWVFGMMVQRQGTPRWVYDPDVEAEKYGGGE